MARKKRDKGRVAPAPGSAAKKAASNGIGVPPGRTTLNREQTMGVKLMSAREVIKSKNIFIARLQQKHGARAAEDAKRIGDLEVEVTDLTNQLMQSMIDAEGAQNAALSKELGLPEGAVEYKLDGDGNFYYEPVAGAAPPAPEPEPELTPAERREALLAELDQLNEEEAGPAEEADAEGAEVVSTGKA